VITCNVAGVEAVNSSKADADDPTLIEKVELAAALRRQRRP
jgi:hypothetical protein